jgi:hypothetical protein
MGQEELSSALIHDHLQKHGAVTSLELGASPHRGRIFIRPTSMVGPISSSIRCWFRQRGQLWGKGPGVGSRSDMQLSP